MTQTNKARMLTDPLKWVVFCIYGPQHVSVVQDMLLPALAAESDQFASGLPVFLLNYLDNKCLLDATSCGGTRAADISRERPTGRLGFAESVNFLFDKTRPEYGFFLVNPDCLPFPGCLNRLRDRLLLEEGAGLIEARQWPSEHPKEYDSASGVTPWASCACCLISSKAFSLVGGFDPVYFLYNEDVDLSWRLRLAGYSLIYAQDAVAAHFTGLLSYRSDRYYAEHFYSSRNFLALCYKFFGDAGEREAVALLEASAFPLPFQHAVLSAYRSMKPAIRRYFGPIDPQHFKITGFNLFHELRYP